MTASDWSVMGFVAWMSFNVAIAALLWMTRGDGDE